MSKHAGGKNPAVPPAAPSSTAPTRASTPAPAQQSNPFLRFIPAQGIATPYPHTVSHFFDVFVSINSLETDLTGLFAYVIANHIDMNVPDVLVPYLAPSSIPPNTSKGFCTSHNHADFPRLSKGNDIFVDIITLNNNLQQFNSDEVPFFRLLFSPQVHDNILSMFTELLMCHQVSRLNTENIDNYFQSKENPTIKSRTVLKMLDSSYRLFPQMTADSQSKQLIGTAPFLKYHTSASSTPLLILKAHSDLGDIGDTVFSQAGLDAARAARDDLHDLSLSNQIPSRDIAVAHAYLAANEILPSNWYQGKRAVDASAPSAYNSWKIFFKRHSDLTGNTDGLLRQNYASILSTKMPDTLRAGSLSQTVSAAAAREQQELDRVKIDIDAEKLARYQQAHPNATALPVSMQTGNEEAFKVLSSRN